MNEKNQNMREICSCDKRYSKTCPLEIGRSVLYFDDQSISYTVICSLTNAISDTGADSVASAVLVIRAHRADGSDITFMGKEYVAKSLNFTKEGLCVGNSSGNLAFKLELDDAAVATLEIYVTKIVFVSGVVALFQRNEFYELPKEKALIKHAFLHKSVKQFISKFGNDSKYVPKKLSPLMWQCSCGEICMDFVCPKCSADKKEMFEFTESAILLKQAFVKKTRVPTIVSLSVAVALLASLAITLAILNFKDSPKVPNDDEVTKIETTTAHTTQNQSIKEEYDKAIAYLNLGMYDEALEVATALNHPTLIDNILIAASEHHFNEGNYMTAYDYCVRRKSPENIAQIAEAAYTQAMGASMYSNALTYAQKLRDEAKIEESANAYIVDLKNEQKFDDAYDVAIKNSLDELSRTVANEATEYYIDQKEYQTALDFSQKTGDSEFVKNTAKAAANALVADSKAAKAFAFALVANDEELIQSVVANIQNTDIMENISKYFKYMSFERKQEALATTISISSKFAGIASNGKVYYDTSSVYTPSGTSAVSVSSGEAHTVVLLKNGTVKAFGDNSFGQCNVSSWKRVVAVSAGAFHTVALLEDGTVVTCGLNTSGQCETFRFNDIVMISAGAFHTVALKADGTVYSCGMNLEGQCNTAALNDIKMISAGQTHTLALKEDGTVAALGSVLMGQADVGAWSDIVYISAGNCFSIGVTSDGDVLVCGKPVGTGSVADADSISAPVAIFAGNVCVASVSKNGTLKIVGSGAPDTPHLSSVKFVTNSYITN